VDTDTWLRRVAAEIGVPAPAGPDVLLDLTREVAHGVERKAGPLTLFMLGCAVGGGGDEAALVSRLRALQADDD
jgi:hypothetical protein